MTNPIVRCQIDVANMLFRGFVVVIVLSPYFLPVRMAVPLQAAKYGQSLTPMDELAAKMKANILRHQRFVLRVRRSD